MRPYGKSEQLAKRRKRALKLLAKGKRVSEVAGLIGVTERSIWYWRKDAEQPRDKSRTRSPGRPSTLSTEQCQSLEQALLQGAYAQGYAEDYWTLDRIGRLIRDEFKVRYHLSAVWHLMRRLGWSNQKPQRQALQRDDEVIRRWKRHSWPRIKKVACIEGDAGTSRRRRLLFSLATQAHLGTLWSDAGHPHQLGSSSTPQLVWRGDCSLRHATPGLGCSLL